MYIAVDDVDAHYRRAKSAGVDILTDIHEGMEGAQRGYSARDFEGNPWTFGTMRPPR